LASNHVSNVTFYGCRFHGVAVNESLVKLYGDNITFDYSSFERVYQLHQRHLIRVISTGLQQMELLYNSTTVDSNSFRLLGFGNAIDTNRVNTSQAASYSEIMDHDAANDGGGV